MNTKMNYPVDPMRERGRKNRACPEQWQEYGLWLSGAALVVGLLVYGMVKYSWVTWLYVGLSLTLIVGVGVYVLFFRRHREDAGRRETGRAAELERTVTRLGSDNAALNGRIEGLNGQIARMERLLERRKAEMDELKQQVECSKLDFRLENRYSDILLFLQKLDRWVDDLPRTDREFGVFLKKEIAGCLSSYGYSFVDYSPEKADAYEQEIGSVTSPELVRRAIVDDRGAIVLKGKIYLNRHEQ